MKLWLKVLIGIGLLALLLGITLRITQREELQGAIPVYIVMLFTAFLLKAAAFPLYFWLPASYHSLPAPLLALIGGLITTMIDNDSGGKPQGTLLIADLDEPDAGLVAGPGGHPGARERGAQLVDDRTEPRRTLTVFRLVVAPVRKVSVKDRFELDGFAEVDRHFAEIVP